MSSWPGAPVAAPVVMRGDFLLSATVLTRDEAGLRMRWDPSADLPADATGGAGAYPLIALYGGTFGRLWPAPAGDRHRSDRHAHGRARRRRDHRHAGTDPGRDRTGRSRRAAGQRRPARAGNDQGQPAGHRRRAGARKRDARAGASSQASAFAIGQEWTVPGSEDIRAFASPPPRHGGWTPTTRPAGALPSARAWPMTRTPSANRSAPRSTPWSLPWANGRNR